MSKVSSVSFKGQLVVKPSLYNFLNVKTEKPMQKGLKELSLYVGEILPKENKIEIGSEKLGKDMLILKFYDKFGDVASEKSITPNYYFKEWKETGKNPIVAFIDGAVGQVKTGLF